MEHTAATSVLAKEAACKVARFLEEHKGKEVVALDLFGVCAWTDCFVIATGTSSAHLSGLLRQLEDFLPSIGLEARHKPRSTETEGWTLLDCGDVVIHLMNAESRSFYELERLWYSGKVIADFSAK